MQTATLNCPMCGAAASTDSTRCDHCGARLATVACPSCFGLMFLGEKFCPHCGAMAARTDASAAEAGPCPRCNVNLDAVALGSTTLHECSRCAGIWVNGAALEQICANRERQATVLGAVTQLPAQAVNELETQIRYLRCPTCHDFMNRVNFARCSGVIVDVCRAHGTWFDRDELRRIVEFIRAGGLDVARSREIADLEQRKRELEAAEAAHAAGVSAGGSAFDSDDRRLGISSAHGLLDFLLR